MQSTVDVLAPGVSSRVRLRSQPVIPDRSQGSTVTVGRLAAEWAVLGEGRLFPFAETLLPGRFQEV